MCTILAIIITFLITTSILCSSSSVGVDVCVEAFATSVVVHTKKSHRCITFRPSLKTMTTTTMNNQVFHHNSLLSSLSGVSSAGNSNGKTISSDTATDDGNDEQKGQIEGLNVVIAGGGIMGTSIAYYLMKEQTKQLKTKQGESAPPIPSIHSLTIIDPTGNVGSCASGKAGGLLAKDWRDNTPLQELQELQRYGFELHQQLANEFSSNDVSNSNSNNNPTDYRRLTCAAVAVDETTTTTTTTSNNDNESLPPRIPNKPPSRKLIDLEWVNPDVVLWNNNDDDDVDDDDIDDDGNDDNDDDDDDDDNENDDDDDEYQSSIRGGVVLMGDEETIAQVHPRKLCETMWKETMQLQNTTSTKTKLIQGRIIKANTRTLKKKVTTTSSDENENENENNKSDNNRNNIEIMQSVELEDGTILPNVDILVVACGPWTYEANKWFDRSNSSNSAATDNDNDNDNDNDGNDNDNDNDVDCDNILLPEITAIKCHSILVNNNNSVRSQAIFFDSNGAMGEDDADLEVYPRLDGDLYVNGYQNDECICIETPNQEVIEDDKIQLLRTAMNFVYNNNNDTNNNTNTNDHTQQVCYWPETPDGLPLIGTINPAIYGAYVAAGHSVWGILQGPATGQAMAELILYGESKCIDLSPFSVERYYRTK